MKRTLLAFAVSAALIHFAGAAASAQTATPTPEIIGGIPATVIQTSNVRSAPEARAEIVGRLNADTAVTATARTTDARWLYIESDELSGWLPAFALTLAGDAGDLPLNPLDGIVVTGTPAAVGTPAPVFVAAVGRVNIRREPRIGDNVVGQLNEGETAHATARSSQENDWLLIEIDDEEQGWVAYFAVRVSGDPRALPVLIPDSNADLIPPSIQVTTRFNARMRDEPSLNAPVRIVVPFGALITPLGRTEAGDWVFVRYDGDEGWIDANLLETPPDEIGVLPVFDQD